MVQIKSLVLWIVFLFGAVIVEGEDIFEQEIRVKRDVLKGKDHDLIRSKRYIGRVPVAYMKKALPNEVGAFDQDETDFTSGLKQSQFSQYHPSHFREFQSGAKQAKSHLNPQRYTPNLNRVDPGTSALTDEEIQTLLLMMNGYDLNNGNERYPVGNKRETGKRSVKNFEQPMSFDNALYPGDRLEFLNGGRSKRTGGDYKLTDKTRSRVKKATDLSPLDKVFTETSPEKADIKQTDQMTKEKPKKSIDWSNYFGIDKRVDEQPQAHILASPSAVNSKVNPAPTLALLSGKSTTKGSKKEQERKENETVDKSKDAPDREWMLQEFYKNFAMATNVKRKRESPSKPQGEADKLEKLEQTMTQVGDKIIWDALKYTGAHRDQNMSPDELAQVKSHITAKLSTAYSLEKVREAVDELRQQISP